MSRTDSISNAKIVTTQITTHNPTPLQLLFENQNNVPINTPTPNPRVTESSFLDIIQEQWSQASLSHKIFSVIPIVLLAAPFYAFNEVFRNLCRYILSPNQNPNHLNS